MVPPWSNAGGLRHRLHADPHHQPGHSSRGLQKQEGHHERHGTGRRATDVLAFSGVTGTGAAPTWKKGLGYFINSSTSSTILGISQSTEPEVISNFINVNGVISFQAGNALLDMVDDRRPESSSKLIGLWNRAQRAQINILEMNISRWDRGSKDKPIDLLPSISMMSSPFCGVDMMIDPQMDRSKAIFWDPKMWGRARLKQLDWVETSGGQRFFTLYGSDGESCRDRMVRPGSARRLVLRRHRHDCLLYGLTLPSNY